MNPYSVININKDKFNISLDYEKSWDIQLRDIKYIKILTYNIWGLCQTTKDNKRNKFNQHIILLRMQLINNEILDCNPDIICFQEVSKISLEYLLMQSFVSLYPYRYEEELIEEILEKRNRGVECYVFSRYPAKKLEIYSLEGNLDYTDSCLYLSFNNFAIYNCYFQAGSKYSTYQTINAHYYSKCRKEQFKLIKDKIVERLPKERNIFLVGDFNCDLDGMFKDWPELYELQCFNDSYKILHSNRKNGKTENTDINTMRWNMKLVDKKVRFDGILFIGNIVPLHSYTIGHKTTYLMSSYESEMFLKYHSIIESNKLYKNQLKCINGKILLFPSDHFGVLSSFIIT